MASESELPARPRNLDAAIGFALPARHARGRLVRLGPVLDEILSAHDYPAPIARILAEALVLTALLGATLKDAGGQLTLQAQTESGVDRPARRRLSRRRAARLCPLRRRAARRAAEPALARSPCSARAISPSPSTRRCRTSAIRGSCRWRAAASPRRSSISSSSPSRFRAWSGSRSATSGHVAGGILLQHLPEGEEGRERLHTRLDHPEWEHVRILAETIRADELTDPALPLEDPALAAVPRRGGGPPPLRASPLASGCRCNYDHVRGVLARFGAEERAEMVDDDGFISVDCEFCSRVFPIKLSDLDG